MLRAEGRVRILGSPMELLLALHSTGWALAWTSCPPGKVL